MTEHLSPAEIGRLANYQLHGEELLRALAHIEQCALCREKINSPSKARIIEQLFGDRPGGESPPGEADAAGDTAPRRNDRSWLARLKQWLRGRE